MISILNSKIDYQIFFRYDKDYFYRNLLIPFFEDDITLSFFVCNNSKLQSIKSDFDKVLKFYKCEENDIQFILSSLNIRIELDLLVFNSLENIHNSQENISVFLHKLLEFSINARASDIHIESSDNLVLFRFRIDGRLKTFITFNKAFLFTISSYLKLISNLDITQNRLPLDGRFNQKIKAKSYDFRISTMPTLNDESIVIRILDNKNLDKNLGELGLNKELYKNVKEAIKLTQGLILITGPTGSGKTTTLYSMLQTLNSSEKKIITVEDPVEYKIETISQIAVNKKIGLSFEMILKNILRQDPDIIFIGEIRDKFSLDIALQASLTGHLVLASIHANSAVETINRLFDLSADPFLVSTTLKYIFAQRLVLTFCDNCNSKGCEKCNYSKFYDRTCIAEFLKIDEHISSLIFKKSDINEIKGYLKNINFKTILDDAFDKVNNNKTSLEEVYKVITL